jgi:hypothetical protein
VATLLEGDTFPDLSLAAVGGWLRLRASGELTEGSVSQRQAERLDLTAEVLAELSTAGLLETFEGRYSAVGMPAMNRKPSDEPEATRERQEGHRLGISVEELRARKENPPVPPVQSNPIQSVPVQSSVTPSRVTGRDSKNGEVFPEDYDVPAKDDDDLASEAYKATVCRRCGGPETDDNPLRSGGIGRYHRFSPCPERVTYDKDGTEHRGPPMFAPIEATA